jgi:hypothetical protein
MGSNQSSLKIITVQSVDELPNPLYALYLGNAKSAINNQYNTPDATKLYFPDYSESTVCMDTSTTQYRIKSAKSTRFDKDLEDYCKQYIQRPHICIGRIVYLVQNAA